MKAKTADLLLLVVAILWGFGYIGTDLLIAQNMNSLAIVGYRFLIATIVLSVIFYKKLKIKKTYLSGSIVVGSILFLAFFFQTVAMNYTTVTNVSFFTGINVIFIPLLAFIFNKKALKINHLLAVLLTICGIYFLTGGINNLVLGDILALICAFLFALHIVLIAYYAKKIEIFNLAIYQMLVVAILAFIFAIPLQINMLEQVLKVNGLILLFVGLVPSAICFLCQNIALKYTDEARGSIILNTEALWGALFAIILLGEIFKVSIIIGGLLMFSAVLLDEINFKKKFKNIKNN